MATVPNSKLVLISTPYARHGVLFEAWEKYFGKNDPDHLLIQAESTSLNPTLDREWINKEIQKDPSAGRAEWLAQWREDVEAFLSLEIIKALVAERGNLPPHGEVIYQPSQTRAADGLTPLPLPLAIMTGSA
jgi:hypothetical protein